jgi:hypothetical protein
LLRKRRIPLLPRLSTFVGWVWHDCFLFSRSDYILGIGVVTYFWTWFDFDKDAAEMSTEDYPNWLRFCNLNRSRRLHDLYPALQTVTITCDA